MVKKDTEWELPKFSTHEFKPKITKYCVCIPVIDEGEKFKKQLSQMTAVSKKVDVIILDGGSSDGSTDHGFLKKNNVRTLLVKTDKGKLSAQLRMGYAYALRQGYEAIITIDGNGKDEVSEIERFIPKLEEGYDYIQGSRFVKGGKAINTPWIRYLSIRLIHAPLLSLGAGHWLTDTTNGFRAYSRRYLLDSRVKPFREVFDKYELLAYLSVRASQLGYRVTEIPVTRRYPKTGKVPTKISFAGNLDLLKTVFKTILGGYNPV
jgi:dolichol-phosphate mannosyltransferase